MFDWLIGLYPWTKSLHIISVIAWMAGLLYLPRLFIYHCAAEPGSVQAETFKVMERRLYRAIMTPAMAATWLFGLTLVATPGVVAFADGWFYVKLVCVLAMSGFHDQLGRWRREFAADRNPVSTRTLRLANEIPTVLMIVIVIMVVVQPL